MKLDDISTDELLFDRQESFNDIVSCLVAKSEGLSGYEDRLKGNQEMIIMITEECKKRGFDPAKYRNEEGG